MTVQKGETQKMSLDVLYPVKEEISSAKEPETRWETLKKVLDDQVKRETELEERHPWVPIVTKWMIALAMVILVITAIVAGFNYVIDSKAEAKKDAAMAEKAAEEQAIADAEAKRQEEIAKAYETLFDLMKADCSKCLYGIKNFIEKYHYSALDEKTYLRAAFNRADEILQKMEREGIEITMEVRQKVLHDVL